MRFTIFGFYGLLGLGMASPTPVPSSKLGPRDTRVIDDSIKTITRALYQLQGDLNDKRIRPHRGNRNEEYSWIRTITSSHDRVLSELRLGEGLIRRAPSFGLIEGTGVTMALNGLQSLTNSVISSWIEVKPIFEDAGRRNEMLMRLMDESKYAAAWADAVISKSPVGSGLVGGFTKQGFQSIMERGVQNYRSPR